MTCCRRNAVGFLIVLFIGDTRSGAERNVYGGQVNGNDCGALCGDVNSDGAQDRNWFWRVEINGN